MNKSLILKEIFYFLTISGLVFMALEIIWPNVILAYFNINLLLILWLLVGIIVLSFSNKLDK